MKTGRKRMLWMVAALVLLGSGGAVLFKMGKLPLGQGSDSAAADSSGAGAAVGTAQQAAAGKESGKGQGKGKDKDKEIMPIPVELACVQSRPIAAYYRAASVIEADRLVDLVSKTAGRVHRITVEEGDWVDEGRIVVELENEREQIQLRKAELALADKRRQLDRTARMLEEELISRQEFDDIDSAFQLAEAERDLAEIALEETRIRAPFGGRLTDRKVVLGQQVAPAVPVFTLGDFSPLRVRVHLPETVARKVQQEEPLEAVVERISPVVDPVTSTVRLTLLLDGQQEVGLVGGFVKVRITTDQHHDALAIPKLALVEEGALRSVFVAEADTVRKAEIQTGLYDETHVEVLEGIFPGDYVVTMGQGGLRNGTLIKALNAAETGYKSPAAAGKDPAGPQGAVPVVAKAE